MVAPANNTHPISNPYLSNQGQPPMVTAKLVVDGELPPALATPEDLPTALTKRSRNASSDHHHEITHSRAQLSGYQLEKLLKQGFTKSVANSLHESTKAFALRIWIIDNSSSMRTADGHRFVDRYDLRNTKSVRTGNCSRWEEIRECVNYHMRLSNLLEAPTSFRLLNQDYSTKFDEVLIGQSPANSNDVEDHIQMLGRVQPNGTTPLTRHIREIREQVAAMEPELRRNRQRVCINIATDGLPTDDYGRTCQEQFIESLRQLESLPVWIVIRLCTDSEKVVEFNNDLDSILELSIDVLDDYTAEAKEISAMNPWINYGLQIHRVREFGNHERIFDLIDEQPFSRSEVRDYCSLLFGVENFDGVPDPAIHWKEFLRQLERVVEADGVTWNPLKRRLKPWVNTKKLNRIHGRRICLIR